MDLKVAYKLRQNYETSMQSLICHCNSYLHCCLARRGSAADDIGSLTCSASYARRGASDARSDGKKTAGEISRTSRLWRMVHRRCPLQRPWPLGRSDVLQRHPELLPLAFDLRKLEAQLGVAVVHLL